MKNYGFRAFPPNTCPTPVKIAFKLNGSSGLVQRDPIRDSWNIDFFKCKKKKCFYLQREINCHLFVATQTLTSTKTTFCKIWTLLAGDTSFRQMYMSYTFIHYRDSVNSTTFLAGCKSTIIILQMVGLTSSSSTLLKYAECPNCVVAANIIVSWFEQI